MKILTLFLFGAGLNADAGRFRTRYGPKCWYPLVSDVTRLCFGLEPDAIPIGESVEYLFEEAQRNHEPNPMKRLADKLRLGSKNI